MKSGLLRSRDTFRIGSYKVWRERKRKGKSAFVIAHFWKLDKATESETEEAQVWRLECTGPGPLWFGQRARQTLFSITGLTLGRYYLVELRIAAWDDARLACEHTLLAPARNRSIICSGSCQETPNTCSLHFLRSKAGLTSKPVQKKSSTGRPPESVSYVTVPRDISES